MERGVSQNMTILHAFMLDQGFPGRDHAVQLLASTQDAEEVVLNLLGLQDAHNVEADGPVRTPNTSQPPPVFAKAETVS